MATTLDLNVRPITGNIGAVIDGVDLRGPLADETVRQIREMLVTHGVIFFHDQDITLEQYWAFMASMGSPTTDEVVDNKEYHVGDLHAGNMAPSRHATAVWHADTTSLPKPPIVTALRAVQVPPVGGDTCWSSMYAAYDALSEPMRRMLDGLTAVHSIQLTYDRMQEYVEYFQPKYSANQPPQEIHPVILTHPESGRKALYVNESFTTRIVELSPAESTAVLSLLFRHVESPLFTMRWKWTANDVAIWDNRAVQHFAVPDYETERWMQRVMLAGGVPLPN